MILQGILLTLATGLIWCFVGVVYGRATEKTAEFRLFLALGALCFALGSWGATPPSAAPAGEVCRVAAVMIPAGILGQFGFLALCGAMRRGGHGVSWGIAQSAMLCPFLAGMLFLGDGVSGLRLGGMALLLCALIPLSAANRGAVGERARQRFLFFALSAFTLLGIQQTLTLIPNHLSGVGEAALSWRVPLFSLCGLGWFPVAFYRRETDVRAVLPLALLYGGLVAAGQWMLFQALDLLSRAGAAGAAYPLAVGASIALFFGYSEWIRKERNGALGVVGIALAMIGMILLAF